MAEENTGISLVPHEADIAAEMAEESAEAKVCDTDGVPTDAPAPEEKKEE